jgi:hypothetical protein
MVVAVIFMVLCFRGTNTFALEDSTQQDQGDQTVEDNPADDVLTSLAEGLIDDALNLLAKSLSEKLAPDGIMDELMAGALEMDPSNKKFLGSADTTSLGGQAAYVVRKVYGADFGGEWAIPQTIFFERFLVTPAKVDTVISQLERDIRKSKNPDRDKYNLCLNVTVNLWVDNINRKNKASHRKPKGGVYVRDAEDTLYLYEEGGK